MKFNTLFIAAVTLLAGCSIPDGKLITEIDSDLWAKVCANDAVAFDSAEETVDCDGTETTVPAVTAAQREMACLDGFSTTSTWTEPECAAVTFGDWKDLADYDADPCDPTDTFEGPMLSCIIAHNTAMAAM